MNSLVLVLAVVTFALEMFALGFAFGRALPRS